MGQVTLALTFLAGLVLTATPSISAQEEPTTSCREETPVQKVPMGPTDNDSVHHWTFPMRNEEGARLYALVLEGIKGSGARRSRTSVEIWASGGSIDVWHGSKSGEMTCFQLDSDAPIVLVLSEGERVVVRCDDAFGEEGCQVHSRIF